MKIEIVIDTCEGALYPLLLDYDFKKFNTIISQRRLDTGDIHFYIDAKLFLLIERKEIKDLCSSITDGRYREQKMRILATKTVLRPMYLVEGICEYDLFGAKIESINTSTVIAGITNTILRDQIMVYHTKNVNETAKILHSMAKTFNTHGEMIISQMVGGNVRKLDYTDTIKTVKKANITKRIAFIEMLCIVPGFSKKRVEPLVNEYGTIKNLLQAIDDGKIDEIKKTAGIGKILYERLVDFLICQDV